MVAIFLMFTVAITVGTTYRCEIKPHKRPKQPGRHRADKRPTLWWR